MTPSRVVVVGAGAAGLTAARTLRNEGFSGDVVLIGEEPAFPYARPPLSKQALRGGPKLLDVALLAPADLNALHLDYRAGTRATSLDVQAKRVVTSAGDVFDYDALIIATGARARVPRWVRGHPLAHVLRTLEDAQRLHEVWQDVDEVVIAGAGFLGSEVAASARALGKRVTLVDVQATPMRTQLGDMISERVAALHREHGVVLECGAAIERLDNDAHRISSVRCSNGASFDARLLIVAAGAEPVVEWLHGAGLDIVDGLGCDAFCRAAPNVFAAGDVARWPSARFGRTLRVEHQMNAIEQAAVAARNVLGAGEPYDPVPFFWSDQYDVKIQVHGLVERGSAAQVLRGDIGADRFVVGYVDARGTLRGVLGWNAAREVRTLRANIGQPVATLAGPG